MDSFLSLIIGLFLIIHGIYSLYTSYKSKKSLHWEMPSTTFLAEKIFGKNLTNGTIFCGEV